MKEYLLLDIDGVLLETHGYRAAYVDTANHFLALMGQPQLKTDLRVAEDFEAAGYPAEWDMVPLTIAFFLEYYAESGGPLGDSAVLPRDLPSVGDPGPFFDFLRLKTDALRQTAGFEDIAACPAEIFPKLAGLPRLRNLLFEDRLDPQHASWFCCLECLLLGSETYESVFKMPAPVCCGSYLAEKDRRIISDKWRNLLSSESGKTLRPVVMTYRPSLIPEAAGNFSSAYAVNTPEAECAMVCLDWDGGKVPFIGCGTLTYLEETMGRPREAFCKPHPMHALVSLLYAACGDWKTAADLAAAMMIGFENRDASRNPAAYFLPPAEPIGIAVFEDSASGIRSAEGCRDCLEFFGYRVSLLKYGILSFPGKKYQLQSVSELLFPNINDALDDMLQRIDGEKL